MERYTDKAALAAYNVTACYEDMATARRTIESLERAGVPGSHISLLGPQAEEAAEASDTSSRDEEFGETAVRATLGGAATGAGVGGAVGFLAGAAAFGIPGVGPAVGAGIWAATLGGAAAGTGVGFTAGAMSKIKQSEAWELTLQEVGEGYVVVGAHADDRDELERAVEVLAANNPSRMHRFDAEGHEIAA
ncbi:MAG TPA: hypothetical protein VM324_10205 [Egibacteraceae bacterium]|nr:hypothetical protein [Egibacteraceae bacterium]